MNIRNKITFFVAFLSVFAYVFMSCQVVTQYEPKVAIVYRSEYEVSLGGFERWIKDFDLHKSEKIHAQLIKNKVINKDDVFVPDQITDKQILKAQSQKFLDSLNDKENICRYLFFKEASYLPLVILQNSVLKPMRFATGGTLMAARLSLKSGISVSLGGGFHHAGPDEGEGACIYADTAIAIKNLQSEGLIKKALIIDLDAHQGNGTALCLANDPSTYTFSMHQENIYPIPKAKSDLDVGLPAYMNDDDFLKELDKHLNTILTIEKFDIVFYVAGCDNVKGDPLAQLSMTAAGIVKRDLKVIDACVLKKLPVIMVLAGGFTQHSWEAQHASVEKMILKYGLHKKNCKALMASAVENRNLILTAAL